MTKAMWAIAAICALVFIAFIGLAVFWARGWKNKATEAAARNTELELDAKREAIQEEMERDTDEEAWKRYGDNLDGWRSRR